jgi:GT2 family glycosyltransferase
MKIELSNTTFVIFYRKDTDKRERNLKLVIDYYNKTIKDPKIIVYQEVIKPDETYQPQSDNITLLTTTGDLEFYNRCLAYNKIINIINTDVICFNDVDVIIDCIQLKQAEEYLTNTPSAGVIYPYDGRFLCVDETLTSNYYTSIIAGDSSVEMLKEYEPVQRYVNASTQHVFVGHNDSRGGVLTIRKDTLVDINGFNPLFKNWGYEDIEIFHRSTTLGYKAGRVMTGPCWHFDHTDVNSAKKDNQPYYKENEKLWLLIKSMNKEDLKRFTKTKWTI